MRVSRRRLIRWRSRPIFNYAAESGFYRLYGDLDRSRAVGVSADDLVDGQSDAAEAHPIWCCDLVRKDFEPTQTLLDAARVRV